MGVANPLTAAGVPAVFDSETRTGACGDWCEGPPCVEAAAESAASLADAGRRCLTDGGETSNAAATLDAANARRSARRRGGGDRRVPGDGRRRRPRRRWRRRRGAREEGRGGARGRGGRGGRAWGEAEDGARAEARREDAVRGAAGVVGEARARPPRRWRAERGG